MSGIMAVVEANRIDHEEAPSSDPLLDSDIYSNSFRFSHISRPAFLIDRSSPIPPIRGEFEDAQEKLQTFFNLQEVGEDDLIHPNIETNLLIYN